MPKKDRLEKKAAHQRDVDSKNRAENESREADQWSKGSKGKSKKEEEAEKKAAAAARKAEAARQLAEEEAQLKSKPAVKPAARGADKAAAKKTLKVEERHKEIKMDSIESFAASNLDDALDLLDTASGPSASVASAKDVELHPERRAKAAYKAYEDRMLPILRKENPSLRLTQVKEMLWKMWQKSPENPFNQTTAAYNASKDELKTKVEELRKDTEERLRV